MNHDGYANAASLFYIPFNYPEQTSIDTLGSRSAPKACVISGNEMESMDQWNKSRKYPSICTKHMFEKPFFLAIMDRK